MKGWIARRLEWMDAQFLAAPSAWIQTSNQTVTLANSAPGEIFYTVLGTDPRAPGGSVASAAKRYETPFALLAGERLFARRRLSHRWSAPGVLMCPQEETPPR